MSQTYEFKTEVRKLLHIITHSLYTNREIFLRELVSNASDALDKLRFAQAKGENVLSPDLELGIAITADKEAKRIVITDTGIGMTRDDLAENLGTIARSGSERFLKELADKNEDPGNIIGRFGVGFYSVFMIADKVTVTSKSNIENEPACTWISDGLGSFELIPYEGNDILRGTRIEIEVKDEAEEFLEDFRLKSILQKHSAFIPFPITLGEEHVNTTPALWREPKSSVTKEQYKEFYTYLTFDDAEPLNTFHVSVDAPVQFSCLAFIPNHSRDLFGMERDNYGLDLYVRRVLIQRENKDLVPEYLSFLKGVVDTEDLPLNISRETLQENVLIRKISQTVTKQVLTHLERLAKSDPDAYKKFWETHGKVFRMGYNDWANREKFIPLLRFNSSTHEAKDALTSLDEYIERAKPEQKEIYYIAAPSREAAKLNPHLEIFNKKGLEVLFLYEPVDEFVMDAIGTYKEFAMVPAENAKAETLSQFTDMKKEDTPEALSDDDTKTFDDLLTSMKEILGDRVTGVAVSQRLSGSPAVLVSPDGTTSSMEKLMRIMNKDDSIPQRMLEVNRDHPILRNLLRIFKADATDPLVPQLTEQLLESSLLLEGYLNDPHALVGRINDLMEKASGWYTEIKNV